MRDGQQALKTPEWLYEPSADEAIPPPVPSGRPAPRPLDADDDVGLSVQLPRDLVAPLD